MSFTQEDYLTVMKALQRIKARDAKIRERVVELQFLCKDVKTFIQESCKLKDNACESEYADALIDLEREINDLLALLLLGGSK
jgi:flagellar biosynthesis regulator FlaF